MSPPLSLLDVLQGDEVLINYGQQSNDRLLQFYGFVESSNPADSYVMTSLSTRLQAKPQRYHAVLIHVCYLLADRPVHMQALESGLW